MEKGNDCPAAADIVGAELIVSGAVGNAYRHGPGNGIGVIRVRGYIGEGAARDAFFAKRLPDVLQGAGPGAGVFGVKGVVDHALITCPADGLGHIVSSGRTLPPVRTVYEGQDLLVGAGALGGEGGSTDAVGDLFATAQDTASAYQSPERTSVKAETLGVSDSVESICAFRASST